MANSRVVDTSLPVTPRPEVRARLQTPALAARRDSAWVLPAHIGVLLLALLLYTVNLTASGFANTYYSMAAQAASLNWSAWFWGSLDPSNFITLDKPPLATMLMGLSVRVFGLSSWSILLPEALSGVATVAVLYAIVRRTSGPAAATIAALVAALTPAAVLIFRYNNPDALMTLLLVLSAWAFVRALQDGRLRWVIVAALFVGLAFNTKFLQAWLVLPAFALTYALCAPGSVRRRISGLGVALATVLVSSGWWVAAVALTPAGARPYIGGSTDGTALQVLLSYDGLGRVFGGFGDGGGGGGIGGFGGVGPGPGGSSFSGRPGLLRLFNIQFGGQVAWLLPFALVGGVSTLLLRLRASRTDLSRAAALMWTVWLLVHALVFSLMSGIIHSYYTVAMAPAIGALVGMGTLELWHARHAHRLAAGTVLAVCVAMSALVAFELLNRSPQFLPWLAPAVLVAGLGAAAMIELAALVDLLPDQPSARWHWPGRAMLIGLTLGLVVVLSGPTAYAAYTVQTAYGHGDPAAGPAVRSGDQGRGFGASRPNDPEDLAQPFGGGRAVAQATLDYLVANRGAARWIVAADSADEAAPIQLATGQPVMAMGGFTGSDPALTVATLKSYIASGELRYVVAGRGFGMPGGHVSEISAWVTASCVPVDIAAAPITDLYDCAAAVGSVPA